MRRELLLLYSMFCGLVVAVDDYCAPKLPREIKVQYSCMYVPGCCERGSGEQFVSCMEVERRVMGLHCDDSLSQSHYDLGGSLF